MDRVICGYSTREFDRICYFRCLQVWACDLHGSCEGQTKFHLCAYLWYTTKREWDFAVTLYDSSRVGIEFAKLPKFNVANKAGKDFMAMTPDEWFYFSQSEQKLVLHRMQAGGWLVRVSWNLATKGRQVFDAHTPYTASGITRNMSVTNLSESNEHENEGASQNAQQCELDKLKADCLTIETIMRRAMEEVEDAKRSLVALASNISAMERQNEAIMDSLDQLRLVSG